MKNKLSTLSLKVNYFLSQKGMPQVVIACLALVILVAGSVTTAYGTATTLKDLNTKALVEYIATIFQKWAIPFLVIDGILWALTKDERRKEVYKRVMIGLVVVYILSFMISTIMNTISDVSTTIGGNETGKYEGLGPQ